MTEVFLVRHGQAAFGSENYDRLSNLGRRQCALLGRYFRDRGIGFGSIYSGTLRRHRETLAAMALATTGGKSPRETANLDEYDLGDIIRCWRKTADNPGEKPDDSTDAFYYFAENALEAWTCDRLAGTRDSWENFNDRVLRARSDFLDSPAKRILVITSGGPISALLRDAMQLSFTTMIALNLELANAGVTRLVLTGDRLRLASFNTTSHLEIDGGKSLVSRL